MTVNRGWTLVVEIRIVRRGRDGTGLKVPSDDGFWLARAADRVAGDGRTFEETALALFGTNSFFTVFKTWLKGELVGEDPYGNRYYREKKTEAGRRERRWVVYSKEVEPTRVPPGWVGWLHGRIQEPPSDTPLPSPHFEAEPLPNLTGTTEAYLPPGAVQRGGTRARATGDYEAWRPE